MPKIKEYLRRLQIAAYNDPSISVDTGPYGHSYPWQLYTRRKNIEITAQLPVTYPVAELNAELEELMANFVPKEHFGQYHKGGWSGIALHALDGDPTKDQDILSKKMEKTPALKYTPTMERIIDSLPADKRRVRILRLAPGRHIFWHSDFWHSVDKDLIRLHVPIVTNPLVDFQISHKDCSWQPGELWYGDFTFPHRLQNAGNTDRVHLVIDLINNDALLAMFPKPLISQGELRSRARNQCIRMLKGWNHLFATERRLREWRKQRL